MSYTSPHFDHWRTRPTLKVWFVAALMRGVDPRRMADVTDGHGDDVDLTEDIQLIIGAALIGDIASYPHPGQLPDAETELSTTSVAQWLRGRGDASLSDELMGNRQQLVPQTATSPADPLLGEISKTQAVRTPHFSMTRAAMIAQHQALWPSIAADMKDAASNGLSQAKAGARDWNESLALEWARTKNKLASASIANQLTNSMHNIVGRKHSMDD